MRIKACVINEESDPEYIYRTEYGRMTREIDELTQSMGMDTLQGVLSEMGRLLGRGTCDFSPPVCGLLTRIGYFNKPAILTHAIKYMEIRLRKLSGLA